MLRSRISPCYVRESLHPSIEKNSDVAWTETPPHPPSLPPFPVDKISESSYIS